MPLNSIWLDSRLNDLSIESKNTHNGVLTKELCKLQAVKKISNLQHMQQPLDFIIFGNLNFIFDTRSLYSFKDKVLRFLLQLESPQFGAPKLELCSKQLGLLYDQTDARIGLHIAPL